MQGCGMSIQIDGVALDRDALMEQAANRAARFAGAPAVAFAAHPTLDTVVTVLACLEAGVAAVPIPPDSGPVERTHILTDSGASFWDGQELTGGGSTVDAALVLYTSGTTGPPKGVPVTRSAIDACLDGLAEAWAWTADDVLVHGLPLYHVHGLVLGVLGPLRVGSGLVHTGRPLPERYAAAGGSLYFGVPTVWSRICADPASARALAGARLLVSGSAALPRPVFEALTELTGQAPVERYGMTETLITISTRHDGPREPGAVGTPIRGVQTRLSGWVRADGAGREGGGSEKDGELEMRGPTVFTGYLRRPDANASAFTADGWFRTGDIATIDPDGTHRIVGRASTDLIKSGGFRIGAGEIESALLAHPAVREAAVIGAPHDDLGQEVVAYVVAEDVTAEELIRFVAEDVSWHKRPRRVVFVEALPRNPMGKIQKHRLQ
jgi:fatty acid CoA ligase FadD36